MPSIFDIQSIGQLYCESKDRELSRTWAGKINPAPKACWANAIKLLKKSRDSNLRYVEGFAKLPHFGNLVIEHGWVQTLEGTIIDPTLIDDEAEYFPGITYTLPEVLAQGRRSPPYVWGGKNGWGGFGNTAYKAAHDRAWGDWFAPK